MANKRADAGRRGPHGGACVADLDDIGSFRFEASAWSARVEGHGIAAVRLPPFDREMHWCWAPRSMLEWRSPVMPRSFALGAGRGGWIWVGLCACAADAAASTTKPRVARGAGLVHVEEVAHGEVCVAVEGDSFLGRRRWAWGSQWTAGWGRRPAWPRPSRRATAASTSTAGSSSPRRRCSATAT